jgi:glucosylceramidase
VGWTDWNILLDERGGPNHAGNFCFAPVHADTRTGELHYTPSFFFLGHFSKFVRPGARRVSATTNRSALQVTAFLNTDGRLMTVVLNTSDMPFSYRLQLDAEEAEVTIPAHAIQTVVRDAAAPRRPVK